ncbi:MAG: hypothetical protein LIO78_05365 [Clostridiales bacterium]|nr:hypothetical protein [Clostridiales bacterium]
MTNREKLAAAAKLTAWGYLLIRIDLNLGTLDILPGWLGYLLILQALPAFGEEEPSAKLLRPLGIVLALWEGAGWLAALCGVTVDSYLLTVLAGVVELYFHFQLLTDLSHIAGKYACPQEGKLLTLRTVYTLVATLSFLTLPWEDWTAAAFAVVLTGMVTAIWICKTLFSFRRSLAEAAA